MALVKNLGSKARDSWLVVFSLIFMDLEAWEARVFELPFVTCRWFYYKTYVLGLEKLAMLNFHCFWRLGEGGYSSYLL